MSYENGKGFIRFFTGCDVGDVAQGDVAVCFDCAICNPADDCAWWVIVALIVNLLVSGLLVVRDREKWRRVCEKINSL